MIHIKLEKKVKRKTKRTKDRWLWKNNPERQREYMRNYQKNRYHNDAKFREMMKEANRKNQVKVRAEKKTWRHKYPEKWKKYIEEYRQRPEVKERLRKWQREHRRLLKLRNKERYEKTKAEKIKMRKEFFDK